MIFIYRREAQSPNPQPIRGQASCRGPITVPTLTRGSGAHCTVGRTMPPSHHHGNANAHPSSELTNILYLLALVILPLVLIG